MRVKSLADIGMIDASTPQARQLKQALAQYEKDSRVRGPGSVTANTGQATKQVSPLSTGATRDPQAILAAMVQADPELAPWEWEEDFTGAVPGRKFELDLASPQVRLGIEVDGWQYHGRYKDSFLRDRDKDYMLSLQGWVLVRIQAGLVSTSPGEALERVRRFVGVWAPRQRHLLTCES